MSNCNDRYFIQKQHEGKWAYFMLMLGRGVWIDDASKADIFNRHEANSALYDWRRDFPHDKFRMKLIEVR